MKTKDITSADAFLRIAIRLLKYLISRGRVTTPTAIREETKAAICAYPAPASRRVAPSGKATKPGIIVMDPAVSERTTPKKPELEPISFDIISGLKIARVIPANIITERISGRIPEKDFQAFRRAIFVLFLSFK